MGCAHRDPHGREFDGDMGGGSGNGSLISGREDGRRKMLRGLLFSERMGYVISVGWSACSSLKKDF